MAFHSTSMEQMIEAINEERVWLSGEDLSPEERKRHAENLRKIREQLAEILVQKTISSSQ